MFMNNTKLSNRFMVDNSINQNHVMLPTKSSFLRLYESNDIWRREFICSCSRPRIVIYMGHGQERATHSIDIFFPSFVLVCANNMYEYTFYIHITVHYRQSMNAIVQSPCHVTFKSSIYTSIINIRSALVYNTVSIFYILQSNSWFCFSRNVTLRFNKLLRVRYKSEI